MIYIFLSTGFTVSPTAAAQQPGPAAQVQAPAGGEQPAAGHQRGRAQRRQRQRAGGDLA